MLGQWCLRQVVKVSRDPKTKIEVVGCFHGECDASSFAIITARFLLWRVSGTAWRKAWRAVVSKNHDLESYGQGNMGRRTWVCLEMCESWNYIPSLIFYGI